MTSESESCAAQIGSSQAALMLDSGRFNLQANIPILPILSGTFASKSYGPSLSGIDLVIQTNVSTKCVSTKCAEEEGDQEPVQN